MDEGPNFPYLTDLHAKLRVMARLKEQTTAQRCRLSVINGNIEIVGDSYTNAVMRTLRGDSRQNTMVVVRRIFDDVQMMIELMYNHRVMFDPDSTTYRRGYWARAIRELCANTRAAIDGLNALRDDTYKDDITSSESIRSIQESMIRAIEPVETGLSEASPDNFSVTSDASSRSPAMAHVTRLNPDASQFIPNLLRDDDEYDDNMSLP